MSEQCELKDFDDYIKNSAYAIGVRAAHRAQMMNKVRCAECGGPGRYNYPRATKIRYCLKHRLPGMTKNNHYPCAWTNCRRHDRHTINKARYCIKHYKIFLWRCIRGIESDIGDFASESPPPIKNEDGVDGELELILTDQEVEDNESDAENGETLEHHAAGSGLISFDEAEI